MVTPDIRIERVVDVGQRVLSEGVVDEHLPDREILARRGDMDSHEVVHRFVIARTLFRLTRGGPRKCPALLIFAGILPLVETCYTTYL